MKVSEKENVSEIFASIGGIRHDCMMDKTKEYMAEIKDVVSLLNKTIIAIENACCSRGTKTTGFENYCRELALLAKSHKTITNLQLSLKEKDAEIQRLGSAMELAWAYYENDEYSNMAATFKKTLEGKKT